MPTPTSKKTAGTARTTTTKKAPAKKAPAKKAPVKKAPAKKAPAKAPSFTVGEIIALIGTRRMARPRGWNRDALVAFFVGGGWADLPVYGAAGLSAEARARGEVVGWVVPAEAFSPGRAVDQSQANSLRAYIRDVVLAAATIYGAPNVPTIDAVATMLEARDGKPVVVIYRRA